jgi:uncharacterized membrane protein
MKAFFRLLRTTLTGGILFLLPVVLLFIILSKAYEILHKLASPLAKKMPDLILGLDGSNLLAILLIVLICFISGFLFKSVTVQGWIKGLEENVLAYLPGYFMIKSIAADAVGNESAHEMTTVLIKDGDTWNIGFLVEENAKLCTVFIPEAPRHDSGEVKIVPLDWIKKVNVGANRTALSLKRYGKGALAHID